MINFIFLHCSKAEIWTLNSPYLLVNTFQKQRMIPMIIFSISILFTSWETFPMIIFFITLEFWLVSIVITCVSRVAITFNFFLRWLFLASSFLCLFGSGSFFLDRYWHYQTNLTSNHL